jgi:hypothetical protein
MRCSVCEVANYVRLWHLADIAADGSKADIPDAPYNVQ